MAWLGSGRRQFNETERNVISFSCNFVKVEFKRNFTGCPSDATARDLHFILEGMARLNSEDVLRAWESETE